MSRLIPIGNSLGVRIPKILIIQLGFNEDTELEMKITDEGLLISPVSHGREGWAECFKEPDDLFLGEEIVNQFDKDEWEW